MCPTSSPFRFLCVCSARLRRLVQAAACRVSMAPRKRARSRSPSPQLPLHLLTSLPSSSSSTLPPRSSDPSLARLPDSLAHGLHAHEARLLDPREWTEWLGAREADEGRRSGVRWAGSGDETGEVYTDRYVVGFVRFPLLAQRGRGRFERRWALVVATGCNRRCSSIMRVALAWRLFGWRL